MSSSRWRSTAIVMAIGTSTTTVKRMTGKPLSSTDPPSRVTATSATATAVASSSHSSCLRTCSVPRR